MVMNIHNQRQEEAMKSEKQLTLQTGQLDPEDRQCYVDFARALHEARGSTASTGSANRESSEGPVKGEVKKKKARKT